MQQITAAPAASASRLTRTTRYTDVIRSIEGGLDALAAGRPDPPSLSNRGVHMVIRRISLEATGDVALTLSRILAVLNIRSPAFILLIEAIDHEKMLSHVDPAAAKRVSGHSHHRHVRADDARGRRRHRSAAQLVATYWHAVNLANIAPSDVLLDARDPQLVWIIRINDGPKRLLPVLDMAQDEDEFIADSMSELPAGFTLQAKPVCRLLSQTVASCLAALTGIRVAVSVVIVLQQDPRPKILVMSLTCDRALLHCDIYAVCGAVADKDIWCVAVHGENLPKPQLIVFGEPGYVGCSSEGIAASITNPATFPIEPHSSFGETECDVSSCWQIARAESDTASRHSAMAKRVKAELTKTLAPAQASPRPEIDIMPISTAQEVRRTTTSHEMLPIEVEVQASNQAARQTRLKRRQLQQKAWKGGLKR